MIFLHLDLSLNFEIFVRITVLQGNNRDWLHSIGDCIMSSFHCIFVHTVDYCDSK